MSSEFETGFFVRQPAWHKQGNVLTEVPEPMEAYQQSGLDWNVALKPLFVDNEGAMFKTSMNAIQRMSDDKVLGFAGNRYHPYQNIEAFKWSEPLIESGYWQWETAGSLKGGEVCWGLMKQAEYQVVPLDVVENYLLITWGHTGRCSVLIQPTSIRVVCNNTLQMALNSGKALAKVRHHSGVVMSVNEVINLYNLTGNLFAEQQENMQRLLDINVSTNDVERIVDTLYPAPVEASRTTQEKNKLVKAFAQGTASGHRALGIQDTGYGLLMAISEANEHFIGGRRIKDRGMNILFGNGQKVNNRAYELIKDLA